MGVCVGGGGGVTGKCTIRLMPIFMLCLCRVFKDKEYLKGSRYRSVTLCCYI